MPIGRDEWKKGRKVSNTERAILQYLTDNRTKAFSLGEITDALYSQGRITSLGDVAKSVISMMLVETNLRTLIRDGSVKARQIEGQTYYVAD